MWSVVELSSTMVGGSSKSDITQDSLLPITCETATESEQHTHTTKKSQYDYGSLQLFVFQSPGLSYKEFSLHLKRCMAQKTHAMRNKAHYIPAFMACAEKISSLALFADNIAETA